MFRLSSATGATATASISVILGSGALIQKKGFRGLLSGFVVVDNDSRIEYENESCLRDRYIVMMGKSALLKIG